jgi:hypothetical protein
MTNPCRFVNDPVGVKKGQAKGQKEE